MKQIFIILIVMSVAFLWLWAFPLIIYGDETIEDGIDKMLVVAKGTDAYDLLLSAKHEIISSNVNFDLVGDYQVKYQNEAGDIINRVVRVVDFTKTNNDDTFTWFNEDIYIEKESLSYYSTLFTSCALEDNKFAYAIKYKKRNDPFLTHNVFIEVVDGVNNAYSYLLSYSSFTEVHKMIYHDGKIIGTGRDSDANGNYLLWIFTIDLKTNRVTTQRYGTSGDVEATDVIAHGTSYYLVGKTNSNAEPFLGTRKGYDGFLAQIDQASLDLKMAKTYPLDKDDAINHIVVNNQMLYLGQTYLDNTPKMRLLAVDFFGNLIKAKNFDYPYSNELMKLAVSKDDEPKVCALISLYNYQKQQDVERLYELSNELEFNLIEEFDDGNWQISDCHFNDNNSLALLLIGKSNSQNYKIIYRDLAGKIRFAHQFAQSSFVPASFVNNSGHLIMGKNNLTHLPSVKVIDTIIIDDFGNQVVNTNEQSHCYQVYINEQAQQHNEKETLYPSDLSSFGTYTGLYVFNSDSIKLVYPFDLIVEADISVSNMNVYDQGIVLRFNGEGILNGEKIYPEKMITEIGDYLLTVKGNNSENLMIEFRVEDLSVKPYEENQEILQIVNARGEFIERNDELNWDLIEKPSTTNVQKKVNTDYWFLILPLTSLVLASFILIKFKG